jgi:uncharacterized protein (DUF1800 family)
MLSPLAPNRWDFDAAAHLLLRAGFGGSVEEIEKVHALGSAKAVNSLVDAQPEYYPPPAWANSHDQDQLRDQMRDAATPEQKQSAHKLLGQQFRSEMSDLTRWWVTRMMNTRAPFIEKMTLFWHGHFATSGQKVRPAYKMWFQNETLRQNGLGNFANLTKAISRDPAMMVWLDTVQSKKEKPNENFAREVMELFTLGEGHYSETDIKEAARAFTGYRIDRDQFFRFAPMQFDSGPKTFMGKTGPWTGDQIIDIIVSQPQCARFIAAKIWKFFAYEATDPKFIDALASELLNVHYEIRPFMKAILSAQEFYGPEALNSQIKSPVQFVVQAFRTMPIPLPESSVLEFAFRQMGQVPFYPPNVKGWDGGNSWINTATLTFRYKLARQLIEGIDPVEIGLPKALAMDMTGTRPTITPASPVDQLITAEDRNQPHIVVEKLFVRIFQCSSKFELTTRFREFLSNRPFPLEDSTIRGLVVLMMTTPNYQVT